MSKNWIERPIDRRRLFQRAGAAGLAVYGGGLLAACGSDDAASSTTTAAAEAAELGGDLNLFTWEGYDMQKVFKPWYEENGITLNNLGFINTSTDPIAKLNSPSGQRIDATTFNSSFSRQVYEDGLTQGITVEDIPELDDLYPFFKDSPLFRNEDGTFYCVPWTWGFTSISYTPDTAPAPESYQDLLDPKNKNRIGTLDDSYNNVLLGAIATGINPDEMTKDQLFGPVKDFMRSIVEQSKTLAPSIGDEVNLLTSGEVDYMLVGLYLVDVFAKDKGGNVKTVVPEEGVAGFTDCTAIAANAPDRDNAIAFAAQFITPGELAGEAQDSIFGATTNPEVVDYISKPVRNLYPYDDIEGFLEDVVMPAPWPQEEDGDRATFDDTVKAWEEAKAEA